MGDTISDIDPVPVRTQPDREGLYMLASEQAGHFTTAQAAEYAVSPALLSYHAATGTVRRIYPGVYRFRDYPSSSREMVVAAWLAVGKDSAVVSHESALDLWDLTDLIPDAIHLTVPRSRRNLPKLPGVRIHTTTLSLKKADVRKTLDSIPVTSPQRTLLDVATIGADPSQVVLGIRQARARGWIDEMAFEADAHRRGQRVAQLVSHALSASLVRAAS